ncbi:hypothetical protein F5876DRAFT_65792 [Lentinula aff. lateritia]|uniref:Uncharacterized protein n=1 Tax=Lentinula aff. lateritia TaxID=2804960 RepID=A0ACC1TZW7_9AGAR|nr:hypothetical protein F5876DRAFT_65792 [Lentinula aff. lateritia]
MSQLDAIEIQVQVYAKSPLPGIIKTNPSHRNWYHYVEWAQFGIVIYEYLITFDLEVERFWKRKTKGLGSVFFYINRYFTLLGNIGIIVLFMSPELVVRHNIPSHPFGFIFSFEKRSSYSESVLYMIQARGTASQVQFYLANWEDTSYINTVFPMYSTELHNGTTLKIYREEHFSGGVGIMIMRDGLLYFAVITLFTLANMVTYLVGTDITKSLLTILSNSMSAILMSRLMLNLRRGEPIESLDQFSISELLFSNRQDLVDEFC